MKQNEAPEQVLKDLPLPPDGKEGWPWALEHVDAKNDINDGAFPKISIIIPSYNRGATIERTIRSVLLQHYSNVDLIVIDGGSKDETGSILRKYAEWIDHCVSEPDTGLYDAINKGIRLASGRWIGVIATDDWYEPRAFFTIAAFALNNPGTQVILGALNIASHQGKLLDVSVLDVSRFPNVIQANHPTWFVRRDVYIQHGGYSLRYPIAADLDILYRFCRAGVVMKSVGDVIATHTVGGVSTDSRNRNLIHLQFLRIKYRHQRISRWVYWRDASILIVQEIKRRVRAGLSLVKQWVLRRLSSCPTGTFRL